MIVPMARIKNPHAVQLGRLGGSKRGVAKGFAADPERARQAGIKSGKVRRAKKVTPKRTAK